MQYYRLANQQFCFLLPVPELLSFKVESIDPDDASTRYELPSGDILPSAQFAVDGLIFGQPQNLSISIYKDWFSLTVQGCGEFGGFIRDELIWKTKNPDHWSRIDREILLGPVIVLMLALRNVWSLHASAAMFKNKTTVFLGESGRGKSTLAKFLSDNAGWQLVADDILPAQLGNGKVTALPHFPQLKIPPDAQPGLKMPEQIPLDIVCELIPAAPNAKPAIKQLPPEQAARVLLSHTAGTRLFGGDLLEKHLSFCAQAAEQIPVYQLTYPHSREALPRVQEILESVC